MRLDIQILRKFFPSVLFCTTDESIHLTFDDGPHPNATPFILQELRNHDIRATFFLLGQNVQKFPDLAYQIHADGHQIGNHSFTHTNLFFKKKSFVRDEILKTTEIIEAITNTSSRYFRPPYGYLGWTTLNVLRELGLICALWNVDSKDYKLNSIADISRRVLPYTTNGSILLLHENYKTSQRIQTYLPILLDSLHRKGFIFKPLPS